MTRFEDLTQSEQAAITQARVEAGKRPIPGYPLPTAYANAPNPFVSTITAQDFAPPAASTFAQAVEAAIAVRLGKKRYKAAIRDVMDSWRVITVSDAEMIGALLGVPGSVILSNLQAIKKAQPEVYWWC